MGSILDAVSSPEFLAGLRWGGIFAVIGLVVGLIWRRLRQEPAPIAGLIAVGAAAVAITSTTRLSREVWVGLGLLALAGVLFLWTRRTPLLPIVAALPGAWLISRADLPGPAWVIPLALIAVALAGPLISLLDDGANPSAVPTILFAISAAGVWATVPDTEEALVLLGAMAGPTLLAWPLGVARLGPIGTHALVGLYVWVAAWGGRGRPASTIGAVAAVGMLVAGPVGTWLGRRPMGETTNGSRVWLVALHLLTVAVTTRMAGLLTDPIAAAVIAASALVVALLLWILVQRSLIRGSLRSGRHLIQR